MKTTAWTAMSGIGALMALAVLGCGGNGGGGGGGPTGPTTIDASGTYSARFTSEQATDCGGLVPLGATDGTLTVVQSGTAVTLRLTQITDVIKDDPQGTIDTSTGAFTFTGPIMVGNEQGQVTAQGTIDGTFTNAGAMALAFDFTALTCHVTGTITGQQT